MDHHGCDEAQILAVEHTQGPCLVLAGPGSGKTKVLCERVSYLIDAKVARAEEILVITFTKAAAIEMKERFLRLRKEDAASKNVTFGTFHAIFFQILKQAYGFQASSILKESEKSKLISDLISEIPEEIEETPELLEEILHEISVVKNTGTGIMKFAAKSLPEELFRTLFVQYEHRLLLKKKLDFDDMIVRTLRLFEKDPQARLAWQQRFSYFLVDEFQDINPLQFEILRLLALPQNNVFMVGDDDQSIYAFRGSRPELMLHVNEVYPDVRTLYLNRNYRSKQQIVKLAGAVIANNKNRYEKETLIVQNQVGICELLEFSDCLDEARGVCDRITSIFPATPYEEIAVLVRTVGEFAVFESEFLMRGIPYQTKERKSDLYHHWIADDLMAYCSLSLQLAGGRLQRRELLRIMNRPSRYLLRDSVEQNEITKEQWAAYYSGSPKMQETIAELFRHLERMQQMSAYAALVYIRKVIGYENYLIESADRTGKDVAELYARFDLLLEDAKGGISKQEWMNVIRLKRREEEKNRQGDQDRKGVHLMTMHGAKGLEFECVFLADCVEAVVPGTRAVLIKQIEEERRLFYVAMTRAKGRLYFCVPAVYRNHNALVSRFVAESGLIPVNEKPEGNNPPVN